MGSKALCSVPETIVTLPLIFDRANFFERHSEHTSSLIYSHTVLEWHLGWQRMKFRMGVTRGGAGGGGLVVVDAAYHSSCRCPCSFHNDRFHPIPLENTPSYNRHSDCCRRDQIPKFGSNQPPAFRLPLELWSPIASVAIHFIGTIAIVTRDKPPTLGHSQHCCPILTSSAFSSSIPLV